MASQDVPDVDKLSDNELREKLKDFGCTAGPVTRSNRKTLTTKLKGYIEAKSLENISKALRRGASVRYSSGEESHSEDVLNTPTVFFKRNPRKMSSSNSSPSPASKQLSGSPNTSTTKNKHQRKGVSMCGEANLNLEDSDSDVDVVTNHDPPSTVYLSSSHDLTTPHMDTPSHSRNTDSSTFNLQNSKAKTRQSSDRKQNSPTKERGRKYRKSVPEAARLERESYGSDSFGSSSQYLNTETNYNINTTNIPKLRRRKSSNKAHVYIQTITLIGLIGIVYYVFSRTFGESIHMAAFDSDQNYYPICGQENVHSSICVEDVMLMPALELAQIFVPKIQEDAINAFCEPSAFGESVAVPSISEEEALMFLKDKLPSRKPVQIERDLKNFKILVLANPHWEVQIIASGMRDIEKILFYGEFAAKYFTLPLACYVNRIVHHIPNFAFFIIAVIVTIYLILLVYRFIIRRQECHRKNVYRMVNQILHVVYEQKRNKNSPEYIPIDNCRDLLIHPEARCARRHEWDEAVAFIRKYESRIRTEIRNIRGEFVKVWLWVPLQKTPTTTRYPDTSQM